jgi:hypothetical protein
VQFARESIETLEASLPASFGAATDSSLLLAANFRIYTGQYSEAREAVERLLAPNGQPQTPLQHQAQVRSSLRVEAAVERA